jgi:hypothetical protein
MLERRTFARAAKGSFCAQHQSNTPEIADHFAGNEIAVEHARLRLAHAVLVVAGKDGNDADQLKKDALRVMALGYRKRD